MSVGETVTFYCGGHIGYWQLNGVSLGELGTSYTAIATQDSEGQYNCTDCEGTIAYSSAPLRIFSEHVGDIHGF